MIKTEHILWIHIVAGAISLLIGLFVFLMKKGGIYHKRLGEIYFWAMFVVFITSVYVSVIKQNWFLLLIGFFSFYLVFSGIRYSKIRQVDSVYLLDLIRVPFFTISFISMIIWGIWGFSNGKISFGIILILFGSIGSRLCLGDIKLFLLKQNRVDKRSWMKDHVGRMTGSYISAFTAFAVNNITFLPPLAIWLSPTVIGILVIVYYYRKYKLI